MTELPTSPPASTTSGRWGPPTTPVGVPASYRPFTPGFVPQREAHPTLPLAAGVGAIIVLVASLLASKFVLDQIVDFGWPVVVYVALLGAIGYGPSVAWWWFSMGRWGSGGGVSTRLRTAGVEPRWSDLGWGPLIWVATILVQVAITAIVLILDVPITSNADDLTEIQNDRTYAIAIVVTAVVAAPLVEELVFRGIVLRSLLSKMPMIAAVGLQGVLFGVAHVDPLRGVGNVGLACVLSAVGISFGAAAYWLRRIGPTIVAHAIFNGVVMILLLTGIRDRLLENNPDPFDQGRSVAEQVAIVDQPHIPEPHRGGNPDTAC